MGARRKLFLFFSLFHFFNFILVMLERGQVFSAVLNMVASAIWFLNYKIY